MGSVLLQELVETGWEHVATVNVPGRQAQLFGIEDLGLGAPATSYLKAAFADGLYGHQKSAVKHSLDGEDVCMTTGTASGKSVPFYVSAIELLQADPRARAVAIYPLKALGWEQEQKWRAAFERASLVASVGRIDGQVPVAQRSEIVRRSKVLIMTPDIIHAWLLSNLGQRAVIQFLERLRLVIVDEIHNYSGVFGSNSAFLFRRLEHVLALLGTRPQFVCASATVAEPGLHLRQLIGRRFRLVGTESDTSPKHPLDILLVRPPKDGDLLAVLSSLLGRIASEGTARFIAFVDSRKQSEYIASIIGRDQEPSKAEMDEALVFDHLERLNVLPYRAGYERHDRELIQRRLTDGSLRGVVSTSALELGIDIPGLDLAVLVGVPRSSTSLLQRIGRIGRHGPGAVIVVGGDSVTDEAVFAKPESILSRPQNQGALYLENPRIQYIHALCLARHGGEHDQLRNRAPGNDGSDTLSSNVEWPDGFLELCEKERIGQVPADLQPMKMESGDDPNHYFPLRDVESQFHVEVRQGPDRKSLGSVSHSQLLREAYPGAVYYYTTEAFRVYQIHMPSKQVLARKERKYTTTPSSLPTLVFPNLTAGNVFEARKHSDLFVAECNLQIREAVCGFKERRGPNEFDCHYPPDRDATGINFPLSSFSRNYFTTGVIFSHPCFEKSSADLESVASLLFEYFLLTVPFERSDVGWAIDRYRAHDGVLEHGARFISVHDQTYGSLRLSGRLLAEPIMAQVLSGAESFAREQDLLELSPTTANCLATLASAACHEPAPVIFAETVAADLDEAERVIRPGSRGWSLNHENEEFLVSDLFFNPKTGSLMYRGQRDSLRDQPVIDIVPVSSVREIPGVSEIGFYDYETGQVVDGV
ncbi:MAG: DEAD/DEAH box helicase [Armatimonadetes bacterium]|nr:DEAD/DEAH box helicase [Armatimonadota bacterium]